MKVHRLARFTGVLLAFIFAYTGQSLLDRPDTIQRVAWLATTGVPAATAGFGLLLTAALVFAVAAPAPRLEVSAPLRGFRDHPLRLARPLFLLALLGYTASAGLYLARGENAAVRLLWLGSIGLLITSQVPWAELPSWLRGAASGWRSMLWPAALLALALLLRSYRLADLPQDLHGDMASHGLQALELLRSPARWIGLGWADIPLPGFLPAVLSMRLTGDYGLVGLALPSVVGGVMSVWGAFLWARELLGRRAALLASALLAFSFVHIHFSRIAEYMDPAPWVIWALVFLTLGLRRGRSLFFVLSGVLLAGGSVMYYAGRAGLILAALLLIVVALVDRPRLRANRRGLLWLGLGVILGLGPLLILFLQAPDAWLQRSREVWLFSPAVLEHSRHKYGVDTVAQIVVEQLRRSLLMFNRVPDNSTQFGIPLPLLDSITAPLMVLGAAYALAHPRRWRSGLPVLALATLMLVGSVATDNPPFWPRLVLILPPATMLAALAIDRAWQAVTDAFGHEMNASAVIVVTGVLLYVAVLNWTLYYQFARSNGRPRALVGRFIESLPSDAVVCIVPDDDRGWIHAPDEREVAFFMGQRSGVTVTLDGDGRIVEYPAPCLQPGAVWIVPEPRQALLSEIQQRLPGSVVTKHGRRAGEVAFFAVH